MKNFRKFMLINVLSPQEARIAIVNGDKIENFLWDISDKELQKGDIYIGRVKRIERGLQAAFIDMGNNNTGFLHQRNIYLPTAGFKYLFKPNTNKKNLFSTPPVDIFDMLEVGDLLLVQLLKNKFNQKSPQVTTNICLPGRYLVYMPESSKVGVSKKIKDYEERHRLKQMLKEIGINEEDGFIIRTASENATPDDFIRDVKYLKKLWAVIKRRVRKKPVPGLVYKESDIVIKAIRDIYNEDIEEILVDDKDMFKRVREFMGQVIPQDRHKVILYQDHMPIFKKFRVDSQIATLFQNKVYLPNGAYIIIETTEAMTTIDINSGSVVLLEDNEETAYRINLEAIDEIVRQIILRDLGGIIVIDFIDMHQKEHLEEVRDKLIQALSKDKAKWRISEFSQFCIIEITRQRLGNNINHIIFEKCPYCNGKGMIKNLRCSYIEVKERLYDLLEKRDIEKIVVNVRPELEEFINNEKREEIYELEKRYNKKIKVIAKPKKILEETEFILYNKNAEDFKIVE